MWPCGVEVVYIFMLEYVSVEFSLFLVTQQVMASTQDKNDEEYFCWSCKGLFHVL